MYGSPVVVLPTFQRVRNVDCMHSRWSWWSGVRKSHTANAEVSGQNRCPAKASSYRPQPPLRVYMLLVETCGWRMGRAAATVCVDRNNTKADILLFPEPCGWHDATTFSGPNLTTTHAFWVSYWLLTNTCNKLHSQKATQNSFGHQVYLSGTLEEKKKIVPWDRPTVRKTNMEKLQQTRAPTGGVTDWNRYYESHHI